jgi:hypothetical protein
MGWMDKNDWDPKRVPVDAVNYVVRENIPGRVLNLEHYSSVMIYRTNKYNLFMMEDLMFTEGNYGKIIYQYLVLKKDGKN